MLVFTRRLHESVVIPGLNITIRLTAVKGNAVRIGIDAPPDLAIVRGELLARADAPPADTEQPLVRAG